MTSLIQLFGPRVVAGAHTSGGRPLLRGSAAFWLRAAHAVLLAIGLFSVASPSSAQLQVLEQWERRNNRPEGLELDTIGYDDCIADEVIDFTLTLNGATQPMEVWAGTSSSNCEDDASRDDASVNRCWQVWAGDPTTVVGLRVRDMIPHGATGQGSGTEVSCDVADQGSLQLYFMLFDGADVVQGSVDTLAFRFDLEGPDAPVLTELGSGEDRLFPKWEEETATDLVAYRIYCERASIVGGGAAGSNGTSGASGNTGVSGAGGSASGSESGGTSGSDQSGSGGTSGSDQGGSGGTSGSDQGGSGGIGGLSAGRSGASGTSGGGGQASGNCAAPTLRPGRPPPDEFRRGEASRAATRGEASGLDNLRTYACGVAAYDRMGNVGNLSNLLCASPEPVTDYFEAYRDAGGLAGGGFCTFGRRGPETVGLALAGLGIVALVRRRRLRSEKCR